MITSVSFYLTGSSYIILFFLNLLVISSILTLIQKNPVHSILFLILTFVSFVFILLNLGIEFISLLFLIIYVGAISILFLFVIMMLNIRYIVNNNSSNYFFTGLILILLLIVFEFSMFYFLNFNIFYIYLSDYTYFNWIRSFVYKSDIESIGFVLFNFFYFEFCLSGIILFIAMIGSISLVVNSNKIAKTQEIDFQLKKSPSKSSLFFLKY